MPKAAISQHFRVSCEYYLVSKPEKKRKANMFIPVASTAYGRVTGIGPNDRLYNVLPLYHSSGCKY